MAYALCSKKEALERELSCDIHAVECSVETRHLPPSQRKHDPYKVVKKHVRNNAEEPRGLKQLQLAVVHLLALWRDVRAEVDNAKLFCPQPGLAAADMTAVANNLASHYVFVVDRLTAVRQDLAILNMPPSLPLLQLLETVFDYYVCSLYDCARTVSLMQSRYSATNKWFDQTLHESCMHSCALLIDASCEALLVSAPEEKAVREVGCQVASLAILLRLFSHLQAACSSPPSTAKGMGMYTVPNISHIAVSSSLSLHDNAMFRLTVKVIGAIRIGNFDRVLLLFGRMMDVIAHTNKLRVLVATTLALMLPAMRGCRALLLDRVSGKDDCVSLACAAKKLYFDDSARAALMAGSLGLRLQEGDECTSICLKQGSGAVAAMVWDECTNNDQPSMQAAVGLVQEGGGVVSVALALAREASFIVRL